MRLSPCAMAGSPRNAGPVIGGDPIFEAEDATVKLGVGKNMVTSIRYWLQAARLIVKAEDG